MSNILFCGNICGVDNSNEMEIDVRKKFRSSSTIVRNSREKRIETGSDNKEYVVDYFLYKVDREPELENSNEHGGSILSRERYMREHNLYMIENGDHLGKPNFRPNQVNQQKSPDRYSEMEEEEKSSRAIDLRASNKTPHLGFEGCFNNFQSPFVTESTINNYIVEQTFGDLENPEHNSIQKSKKSMYYSNIHVWRERRKIIKKIQKLKRINRDKSELKFTISEIQSFSTLGMQNGHPIKIDFDEYQEKDINSNCYKTASFLHSNKNEVIPTSPTADLKIETFNNFEICSKKVSKIDCAGDNNCSNKYEFEKEVWETKARAKSPSVNSITNNNINNIMQNLRTDLNFSPINHKINSNMRYGNGCNNNINQSPNESACEMINMNINTSTSNARGSIHSNIAVKQSEEFFTKQTNEWDNKQSQRIISQKLNYLKRNTLRSETSVPVSEKNSLYNKALDEQFNSLKKNLVVPTNFNDPDPFSCTECEDFYKIFIMHNLTLKIMKCLYCNNVLNNSSLEYYKNKFKPIEKDKSVSVGNKNKKTDVETQTQTNSLKKSNYRVVKSQIEIKSQKKIKEKEATLKFLNLKIKENERLVIVGQPSEEMNQIKTDFDKLKFEYKTNISLKEEIIKQVFSNLISENSLNIEINQISKTPKVDLEKENKRKKENNFTITSAFSEKFSNTRRYEKKINRSTQTRDNKQNNFIITSAFSELFSNTRKYEKKINRSTQTRDNKQNNFIITSAFSENISNTRKNEKRINRSSQTKENKKILEVGCNEVDIQINGIEKESNINHVEKKLNFIVKTIEENIHASSKTIHSNNPIEEKLKSDKSQISKNEIKSISNTHNIEITKPNDLCFVSVHEKFENIKNLKVFEEKYTMTTNQKSQSIENNKNNSDDSSLEHIRKKDTYNHSILNENQLNSSQEDSHQDKDTLDKKLESNRKKYLSALTGKIKEFKSNNDEHEILIDIKERNSTSYLNQKKDLFDKNILNKQVDNKTTTETGVALANFLEEEEENENDCNPSKNLQNTETNSNIISQEISESKTISPMLNLDKKQEEEKSREEDYNIKEHEIYKEIMMNQFKLNDADSEHSQNLQRHQIQNQYFRDKNQIEMSIIYEDDMFFKEDESVDYVFGHDSIDLRSPDRRRTLKTEESEELNNKSKFNEYSILTPKREERKSLLYFSPKIHHIDHKLDHIKVDHKLDHIKEEQDEEEVPLPNFPNRNDKKEESSQDSEILQKNKKPIAKKKEYHGGNFQIDVNSCLLEENYEESHSAVEKPFQKPKAPKEVLPAKEHNLIEMKEWNHDIPPPVYLEPPMSAAGLIVLVDNSNEPSIENIKKRKTDNLNDLKLYKSKSNGEEILDCDVVLGNDKENPIKDMRPIKIRKKLIQNSKSVLQNMQNELKHKSLTLKKNSENTEDISGRFEKLKSSSSLKHVEKLQNEKKLEQIHGPGVNETANVRRASQKLDIAKTAAILKNLDIKKLPQKNNFDSGKINSVRYSFEQNESKKFSSDIFKINDLNMPSVSTEGMTSDLSVAKTQEANTDTRIRSTEKSANVFNPKTVLGVPVEPRRTSNKLGSLKSLLEKTTVEESLSMTEKKLAMAEFFEKKDPGRNFLKRLSEKTTVDNPLLKPVDRSKKKTNLTMVTKVISNAKDMFGKK